MSILRGAGALIAGLAAAWPQPRPASAGQNLALNKVAFTNASCTAGQSAEKAVNGETSDFWCSSGTTGPRWIEVDLAEAADIGYVVVSHAQSAGQPATQNSRDFNIQTSTDGKDWITVVAVQGNRSATTAHAIAPTKARYVKLNVTLHDQGGGTTARIAELAVYGSRADATPTPPPPPPSSNVALGKTAIANGQCRTSQGPGAAVNGSVSGGNPDKWCSNVEKSWLQVDLGAMHGVTQVVVQHAGAGGEPESNNTRDFEIQTSADGTSWATRATVAGNKANRTTHPIPKTQARHVRLNVAAGQQDGGANARIYELEVYAGATPWPAATATPTPTVTPTPTAIPIEAPPGSACTEPKTFAVNASALFLDPDLYVQKGWPMRVSAAGGWTFKGAAAGVDGDAAAASGRCNGGQLVARVGLFGDTVCLSAEKTFTADRDGYLLFWQWGTRGGSGGSLDVKVAGADSCSKQPKTFPPPRLAPLSTFAKACNPPFKLENKDPANAHLFLDEVADPAAWFADIAQRVCSRLYKSADEVRPVSSVTLVLEDYGGIASKGGDRDITVRVSTRYLKTVKSDGRSVAQEVAGIMVHEVTHGFQYDDRDDDFKYGEMSWIIEGIADFVRYHDGAHPPDSLREGVSWTASYRPTAFFLIWLDQRYPDFGYRLNLSLKPGDERPWGEQVIYELTGKPISTLWREYQADIAGAFN